ncbi:MAG: Heme exporter protein C [Alphaproteobacteria bacterium MarineAlpha9_Bin4]|nr:heme transporter HemC [Pelagibacterales bacterium]PPR27385.1 MAG: Heme exporter protein C [Alphaproteobacteria bacterium MarineAlpha9_Bin4]|tara:strand:+ start:742 stop:1473 length:732 start_codon:yes stop_codon:yes gene_type:complete
MIKYFHKFANPVRFLKLAIPIKKISGIAAFFTIFIGLIFALLLSPPDYQQKETVRIMYIHVPSAWMSLMTYGFIFLSSVFFLIWRFPLFLILAKESVPIGIIFTFSALISGALWGKPTWGTYWVWDARLTSFLILFFIFLGLKLIKDTFSNSSKGNYTFAYLSLVGGFNLPIIKFSVDWWNTLHQPASIIRTGGISVSNEMLAPLFLMALGLFFLFIYILLVSVEINIKEKSLINFRDSLKNN